MNIGNILKVADAIEQASVPGLGFNMNIMLRDTKGDTDAFDPRTPACGTVACIAGWAYTIANSGTITPIDYGAEKPAAEWLGLERSCARKLFYPEEISDDVSNDWSTITPSQASSVLRILAITGKVDWEAAMKGDDPVLPPLPASRALVKQLS